MAKITTDEVGRIAHLARIALSAAETKQLTEELAAILAYVEKLNAVDTKQTDITSQVTGLTSVWRQDKVTPSMKTEDIALNAPAMKNGYLKVPKVL